MSEVTGLTDGDSYTFIVTATNSRGTSPASVPSNRVTPRAPAPRDPIADKYTALGGAPVEQGHTQLRPAGSSERGAQPPLSRKLLDRISDKWVTLILAALGSDGAHRFGAGCTQTPVRRGRRSRAHQASGGTSRERDDAAVSRGRGRAGCVPIGVRRGGGTVGGRA